MDLPIREKATKDELAIVYNEVIKPFCNKNEHLDCNFWIYINILFSYCIYTFYNDFNIFKYLIGMVFWQITFVMFHVHIHTRMSYTGTKWYHKDILPYYHHYYRPYIYYEHLDFSSATTYSGLLFLLPYTFIDSTVASSLLINSFIDLYAHAWYHTPISQRRKHFGPTIWYFYTILEKIKVIDTIKHKLVHHEHQLVNIQEVQGWLDVNWWFLFGPVFEWLGIYTYKLSFYRLNNAHFPFYILIAMFGLFATFYPGTVYNSTLNYLLLIPYIPLNISHQYRYSSLYKQVEDKGIEIEKNRTEETKKLLKIE
jgi:hypothetical protein